MAGEGYQLRLVRTKIGNVDDADPNVVPPPVTEYLRLASYRENPNRPIPVAGFRAKLLFSNPVGTATVEIWTLNTAAADTTWSLAGSMTLVPHRRDFIQNDIDDAIVWPRLRAITSGVLDTIQFWGEEAS